MEFIIRCIVDSSTEPTIIDDLGLPRFVTESEDRRNYTVTSVVCFKRFFSATLVFFIEHINEILGRLNVLKSKQLYVELGAMLCVHKLVTCLPKRKCAALWPANLTRYLLCAETCALVRPAPGTTRAGAGVSTAKTAGTGSCPIPSRSFFLVKVELK